MSRVTSIIIVHSILETPDRGMERSPIDSFNWWLRDEPACSGQLTDVTRALGTGPKEYEQVCIGGGINYLDEEQFIEVFRTHPWKARDRAVMIINTEWQEYQVITP